MAPALPRVRLGARSCQLASGWDGGWERQPAGGRHAGPHGRDGDQLFGTRQRRSPEEVAAAGGMGFLTVTGEQAAGVVTTAERAPLSAGHNRDIEPGGVLGVTGQTGK